MNKIDLLQTRCIDGMLTSEVTAVTIPYIQSPNNVHPKSVMVMNDWSTFQHPSLDEWFSMYLLNQFLLICEPAVTLGQGHKKALQYIYTFLVPNT